MHPTAHFLVKCLALFAVCAFSQLAAQPYTWRTAEIGGGGFVTGTDWEYHTFKLDASEGLGGKGFLRVKVQAAS